MYGCIVVDVAVCSAGCV